MALVNESDVKLYKPTVPVSYLKRDKEQERSGGNEVLDKSIKTTDLGPEIIPVKAEKFPKHLYCPVNGFFFDEFAQVTIPLGGAETTIVTVNVPSGYEGYIRYFGQDVTDISYWSLLSWFIKINSATFRPYGAITRQVGTFTEMTELMRKVQEGDVLTITATNSSASVNASAWGRLKGWFYPMPNKTNEKEYLK